MNCVSIKIISRLLAVTMKNRNLTLLLIYHSLEKNLAHITRDHLVVEMTKNQGNHLRLLAIMMKNRNLTLLLIYNSLEKYLAHTSRDRRLISHLIVEMTKKQ